MRNQRQKFKGFGIAAAAAGAVVLIPLLSFLHFICVDQCSIPLWMSPREVRQAVRKAISQDQGERVKMVNLDAFDCEHINVITNRRVFCLSEIDSGIEFEVPLERISSVEVDKKDERYLLILDKVGRQHSMFFVGSPWGFCAYLSTEVDRRR